MVCPFWYCQPLSQGWDDGDGVGEGVGVGVGVGLEVGEGLGEAVGGGVGVGEGEGELVEVGDGEGDCSGVEVGEIGPLPWHMTEVVCATELPPLKVAVTLTMYVCPATYVPVGKEAVDAVFPCSNPPVGSGTVRGCSVES